MPKIFSAGNHNSKEFTDCRKLSPVQSDLYKKLSKACEPASPEPCDNVGRWKPKGFAPLCDPQKTGAIVNNIAGDVRRREIYRYANNIGGCNEAMNKLFSDLIVTDTDNKIHPIPLVPGSQERAVAWLQSEHARKDDSLVVQMPLLPLLALHQTDVTYDPTRYCYHKALMPGKIISEDRENDTILRTSRGIPVNISYTLYAWAEFKVDMHQILTQVLTKCCPATYIEIKGDPWETMVRLDSSADNKDIEVQDQKAGPIIKYQFYLTVETYISEPIVKDKTVLGMAIDFVNSVDEKELTEVYGRIEIEENGN